MPTSTITSKRGAKKAKTGKLPGPQITKRHTKRPTSAGRKTVAQPPAMSILDMVEQMTNGLPEKILDRLPTDGAQELDHYVYGKPKKTA